MPQQLVWILCIVGVPLGLVVLVGIGTFLSVSPPVVREAVGEVKNLRGKSQPVEMDDDNDHWDEDYDECETFSPTTAPTVQVPAPAAAPSPAPTAPQVTGSSIISQLRKG